MGRIAWTLSVIVILGGGWVVTGQAPTLPGTSADRIGFPTGYRDTYTKLYTFDNFQNRQIRVVWANDVALSISQTDPYNFPYGSILLFEDYPATTDSSGEPVLDENGRFVPGELRTIFAMKKDKGFGAEYGPIRNGEWEYVSYRPDGTLGTTPQNSGSCALCHLTGSSLPMTQNLPPINAKNDYVFRPELYFNRAKDAIIGGSGSPGAVPTAILQSYVFVPKDIHVKAGATVTFQNDDQLVHNIVADDGSFNSGYLGTGGSFSVTTSAAGEIAIHCTVHSRMRAKIVVEPAQ